MPEATRYDITLDTGSSTDVDAKNNHYDQVLAMSQGIINASFEELFRSVPETAEMYFESRLSGRLDAVLDAPRIMINGSSTNATEIFYQLRIKSGRATFVDGEKIDFHDWVLSVRTHLNDVSIDIQPGDSAAVKARKNRWLKDMEKSFPGFTAGDYRVQRVFAALGSAGWDRPDDLLSTLYDPVQKKRITFEEWGKKNSTYREALLTMFSSWARKQETENLSTLGIKFSLSPNDIKSNEPTFRPVYVDNQVYPYISEETKNGNLSVGDYSNRDAQNPYGTFALGDYNCLLYCENVDGADGLTENGIKVAARPLPKNRKLGFNGNLAQPASSGKYPIYGSWIMDHRVFLTTFLLPQLQELCMATYTQIGEPKLDETGFTPNYAIGSELEGMPAKSAADKQFAFQRVGDTHYQWKMRSGKDELSQPKGWFYKESPWLIKGYNDYKIFADSSVEVKWNAGDSFLTVEGKVVYRYLIRWGFEVTMPNPSTKNFVVTATWSIKLSLTQLSTNTLSPRFEGLVNGAPADTKAVLSELEQKNYEGNPKVQEHLEEMLRYTLGRGMSVITSNIQNRFAHAGKFTYPGYGELEFKDPQFTRLGNIISTVNYKRPSGPDGTIKFPKFNRDEQGSPGIIPPSMPDPKTMDFQEGLEHQSEPALQWHTDFVYNEKTKIGKLVLRGTNYTKTREGPQPLAFSYICISLIRTPNVDPKDSTKTIQPKLFSDADWNAENPSVMKDIYNYGKALVKNVRIALGHEGDDNVAHASEGAGESGQQDVANTGAITAPTGDAQPTQSVPIREGNAQQPQVVQAPATEGSSDTSKAGAAAAKQGSPQAPASSVTSSESPAESGAVQGTKPQDPLKTAPPPSTQPLGRSEKGPVPQMIEKKGNVFNVDKDWDIDENLPAEFDNAVSDIKSEVKVNILTRDLDLWVNPTCGTEADDAETPPDAFVIPYNKTITIEMQGNVVQLGQYAVRVKESWMKLQNGKVKQGAHAVDYKMVELKQGPNKVIVDAYDISDRLAQSKIGPKPAVTEAKS